jgi:quercetin dioxygenase-like cupin family protein
VIPPQEPFVNTAGTITNIAFGEFACVSIIHSVAGSTRSKHFHKQDSHILYVLEGVMHYWERPLDGEYPLHPQVLLAGESLFTPPLVVHKTYFPVATTLISCSKLPRDHESHESDVVRVDG